MSASQSNPLPNGVPARQRLEDLAAIVAGWLRFFFEPGDVTELRAVGVSRPNFPKPHVEAGFYDYQHLDKMALDAVTVTRNAKGVYFVMNPLRPDILSRRANRIEPATSDYQSSDKDVRLRKWLLIDCDPVRDPLISATAAEKAFAREMADRVLDYFRKAGWPDPILADSGNGYHLFYRMANLPNNDVSTKMIRSTLQWLGDQLDVSECKIDRKVFNASRIVKVPGTMARKGDDTPDRPHRRGFLMSVPGVVLPSI